MKPVTEDELKEIEKLCENAIPGPWQFNLADEKRRPSSVSLRGPEQLIYHTRFDVELPETVYDHNMTVMFIAKSRELIPSLIAEIRRLQEAVQKHCVFKEKCAICFPCPECGGNCKP